MCERARNDTQCYLLGAVRFEGDTVVAIVDHGVLNDNIVSSVGVPTISVVCSKVYSINIDGNIADQDVCRIGNKVEPLD